MRPRTGPSTICCSGTTSPHLVDIWIVSLFLPLSFSSLLPPVLLSPHHHAVSPRVVRPYHRRSDDGGVGGPEISLAGYVWEEPPED
jgi:hypothetical protein